MYTKRIAVIDMGTVSTRLLVADCSSQAIELLCRDVYITHLGEDRANNNCLASGAIRRTVQAAQECYKKALSFNFDLCVSILTSAARDAENIHELLSALREVGIEPQVIEGKIEAQLSFLGVAQDFLNKRILVVDIGGGSTEFVVGTLSKQGEDEECHYSFELESVRSFDIGCKRMSELFEKHDPPLKGDLDNIRDHVAEELGAYLAEFDLPEELICVGGTPTSLVAINKELDPYNSEEVHLSRLNGAQLAELIDKLAAMDIHRRSQVLGLQEQRAPVIVSGAVILEVIMASSGFVECSVSEKDLLFGLARTVFAQESDTPFDIGYSFAISEV